MQKILNGHKFSDIPFVKGWGLCPSLWSAWTVTSELVEQSGRDLSPFQEQPWETDSYCVLSLRTFALGALSSQGRSPTTPVERLHGREGPAVWPSNCTHQAWCVNDIILDPSDWPVTSWRPLPSDHHECYRKHMNCPTKSCQTPDPKSEIGNTTKGLQFCH